MNLHSWGRYPRIDSNVFELKDVVELNDYIKHHDNVIPFGNGRSYGDSALNKNIVSCKSYNLFLNFDEYRGVLHCQSGVLLSEIIDIFVPKGWFFEVTPGTKLITIGGAIASDVHGKNHHIVGCFSEFVEEFNLMLPSGEIKNCKNGDELFHATCGGMGLTGIILDVKIILKKINSKNIKQTTVKTRNLEETFDIFEKYDEYPYSVAWIDCLASGDKLGRSLVMVGQFLNDGKLDIKRRSRLSVPFVFPSITLNKLTVRAFNWFYYNKVFEGVTTQYVDINGFFYPLDVVDHWNRIYGKNGFTQYQFILPKENSFNGLQEILTQIANSGKGSFLAVLKLYGKQNDNYLSFPTEGYGLALDFKIERGVFDLLDLLDKIVIKYSGRVYLTKDVRIKRENFEKGYAQVEKFRDLRKKYDMDKKIHSLQSKRLGL